MNPTAIRKLLFFLFFCVVQNNALTAQPFQQSVQDKDVNSSITAFNQTNTKINNGRSQVLNAWQDAEKRFADEHMPKYK